MMSMIFRALGLGALLVTAFLFSIPLAPPSPVHAALPFEVNTLTDQTDGSCGDGTCSLRDAIALANSDAGPDTIEFDVTGTITVSAALGCLPSLDDDGTTIDGTTVDGYAGTPLVAVTAGVGLSCGITTGIYINGDENVLKGLAIHSFGDDCIDIDSGSGNVIGPDMVISDCYDGVYIGGTAADNTIQDSFIGTDVTGMSEWGNVDGVFLGNTIGPGACSNNHLLDNVISGNDGYGIWQQGAQVYNTEIKGNKIGVAADGVTPLGNGGAGIRIEDGSHDNYIGGSLPGDGNIIAYNAGVIPDTGIVIAGEGSDGNRIAHNSIYDNTDLGIDLGDDGVTCDSGPSADEPNHFMPCPVIESATTSLVTGTTCPNCIVEAFIADPDPSGYGEGRTYLGDTETTDGDFSVSVSGVEACDWITATAIGQNEEYGNTSEFALNVQVPCPPEQHHRRTATPMPKPTATPAPTKTPLPPPPPPTAAPSGALVPAVLPPATGEGPVPDGAPWLGPALLLGAGSALAIGGFCLRAPKGKRRSG